MILPCAVKPLNTKTPFYHQLNTSFKAHAIITELNKSEYLTKNTIDIKYATNEIICNNSEVDFLKFKEISKQLIKDKPNYLLVIHCDKETTFEQYIKLLSAFQEGLNELKDAYSLALYNLAYDQLKENSRIDWEEGKKVRKIDEKYQVRVMEILDEN